MMSTTTHPTLAVNIKDESCFKDLGSRIANARRERNITQVQLAATLGIAQQTLAHYEGGRLPASLLPTPARHWRSTWSASALYRSRSRSS